MTLVRFVLSTGVVGLALLTAQLADAQPGGGKRRPLPGDPGAQPGGGKMRRPLPRAPGGPGGGAKRGDKAGHGPMGLPGRRLADLKEKEKAGTLTEEEKAELEKMQQQRRSRMKRSEARRERLAELQDKKQSGTLTDEEKSELDKIEKIKERHEALKSKWAEHAKDRTQRRRAARRQAMKEFPGLQKDAQARAEYGKHASRMAKLERAREVAQADGRDELVARIDKLVAIENARHNKWVETHVAATKKEGAQ